MMRRLLTLSLACFTALALSPLSLAASKKPSTSKSTKSKSPPHAYAVEPAGGVPSISAAAAIVVDAATGEVLFEKNADDPRAVASTQKLITALVIADEGDLDGKVTVASSDTRAEPSKLYIKAGEVYRRYDLLRILLVKSMNDVACCLARDNAGSVEAFAARMNQKARELGMTNSHFVNPNGLPAPGQYSTARDMAKVAMAAYRNRIIRGLVSLRSTTWRYNDGRVREFDNTNQVLRRWAVCNGMKTGYTEAAGHCLISSASYNGRDVISVILGDKKVWDDSYKMLSWAIDR
jgi:serine-type D-Ala-D-Ala carboxypeptidase (penicillin-binding protein 5/6)